MPLVVDEDLDLPNAVGTEVVVVGVGHNARMPRPPRAHATRLLRDFTQDRCLAGLDLGVRRDALNRGCPPVLRVWLSAGLRLVGHRDEAGLKSASVCQAASSWRRCWSARMRR
jgi:hypothetical protein